MCVLTKDGVTEIGCKGVRVVWAGKMDMEKEWGGPPHGIYLPTLKLHLPPPFLCGTLVEGPYVGGG